MSDRNDGGPAFPQPCDETGACSNNEFGQVGGGMTLRDYFAAKAMHQFLAGAVIPTGVDASKAFLEVAGRAYEMADAMLAKREHTP